MAHLDPIGGMARRDFLLRTGAVAGGAAVARGLPLGAAAQDATPKKGGTLTIGHIGDVDNYDPLTGSLDQ